MDRYADRLNTAAMATDPADPDQVTQIMTSPGFINQLTCENLSALGGIRPPVF